jgi:mono/diheme cytochrome c family protein
MKLVRKNVQVSLWPIMIKDIRLRSLSILFLPIPAILLLSTGKYQVDQDPGWKSPEWTDTIRNPLKGNHNSIMEGKELYNLECTDCHGEKGKGDGSLSSRLTPGPPDFGSIKFQNQSDGAIFWKIANGNKPMPAFGGALSIKQRWQVINYVRTFVNKSN